ncbi:hypothetical protein KP509_39G049500 [Ceratopteris richardii]|uniref:RING-type E3 ubiquitin transferase n=1 Tax=Ceratopteris richardii TaxID=49495 RepID=A0A8T2Q149_CERRI|nr:hypothetical protein KP509_39G049500 [Ceratopteris richardii]
MAEPHNERNASSSVDSDLGNTTWDSGKQNAGSSSSGFDCNICLELAQDPVVTLCGHLFCWPCLYRWLRGHSTCHECPVCKALVEEDKLVPLYGRGNANSSDPRKKPPPTAYSDIPHRPPGQRPPPASPSSGQNHFNQHHAQSSGFNFMGPQGTGAPMAAARFGNFTFSAGFGLFPSLFGFQVHGFPDGNGFGPGYPFGFPMGFHGAARSYAPPAAVSDQQEAKLSRLLMFLGFIVFLYILFL